MKVDRSVPGDVESLDKGAKEGAEVGASRGEGEGCVGLLEGAGGKSEGKIWRVERVKENFTEDVGGKAKECCGRGVCG